MASASTLLTDQHLQTIKDALAQLDRAQAELNLAKQAGIDLPNHQAEIDATRTKLQAMRQTYFPGQ